MSLTAVDLTPRVGFITYPHMDVIELEARATFIGGEYEEDSLEVEFDGQPIDPSYLDTNGTRAPGFHGDTPKRFVSLRETLIALCGQVAE